MEQAELILSYTISKKNAKNLARIAGQHTPQDSNPHTYTLGQRSRFWPRLDGFRCAFLLSKESIYILAGYSILYIGIVYDRLPAPYYTPPHTHTPCRGPRNSRPGPRRRRSTRSRPSTRPGSRRPPDSAGLWVWLGPRPARGCMVPSRWREGSQPIRISQFTANSQPIRIRADPRGGLSRFVAL